jgi:cell division protein FtsI/penicillin-binding protein 2
MTERPRVLVELGDELDRAAQRTLTGERKGTALRSRGAASSTVGGVIAALAAGSAVAVAVVAILVLGHHHPASRKAASTKPAAAAGARGEIVDRSGKVLVKSRQAIAVQIVPSGLPVPIRNNTSVSRLAAPPAADEALYDRLAAVLGIKTTAQRCDLVGNARGHAEIYRPRLPEIACDVAQTSYQLPRADATVATDVPLRVLYYLTGHRGESGLEGFYNQYLRGREGSPGDTLKTSLDLKLQQTGQQSLAHSLSSNAAGGAGGAFVAMDPQNGQVYGMGSLPSFDPSVLTKPISKPAYNRLYGPATSDPQKNRAIDDLYPTGSTFKVITATAALESGVWGLGETYDDTGEYCLGSRVCLHNQGQVSNGTLNLVNAIRVSDDVFFYNLGAKLNADPQTHPLGGPLQQWARLFNLAVGQGGLLVTPLQLAVAYGAIANGGTIVHPHIGLQIDDPTGKVLQNIDPPPIRHISIDPAYLGAIREGLREAASAPGGTSAGVIGKFPLPVYGEAGTAQTFPHGVEEDQAWYAAYVPASATRKSIVVVVTVERGGFGAHAAAPVARQILSQWFRGTPGPYVAGTSMTG